MHCIYDIFACIQLLNQTPHSQISKIEDFFFYKLHFAMKLFKLSLLYEVIAHVYLTSSWLRNLLMSSPETYLDNPPQGQFPTVQVLVLMWSLVGCDSGGEPRGGGGGGYVSLGLVHHPRKSLSEKHPKRGRSLGNFDTIYRETIGQLWFLDP